MLDILNNCILIIKPNIIELAGISCQINYRNIQSSATGIYFVNDTGIGSIVTLNNHGIIFIKFWQIEDIIFTIVILPVMTPCAIAIKPVNRNFFIKLLCPVI